jgi:hypothetical protein
MKKLFLLLLLFTNICLSQSIYKEDFGSLVINTTTNPLPYTYGTNATIGFTYKDTKISNPVWTQNLAASGFTGSSGVNSTRSATTAGGNSGCMSSTITPIGGSSIISCNFNITTGYKLIPYSISYQYRISGTGPQKMDVSITGTTGSNSISQVTTSRTGDFITQTLSNFTTNNSISGSTTLLFTFSSTTGTNSTIRLDNVFINGYIIPDSCSSINIWDGFNWSNNSSPNNNTAVIVNANYNTSNPSPQGSFDACSVTVNSGKNLTINSNQYIKIQNELTNNGNVTVEDGGSIVQVNDNAINTRNITYKRKTTPVTRFDYTYWSTPVSPQTLLDLSPNTLSDKYYRWNNSIPTPNWVNVLPNSNMSIGTGYIIRAPQPFDITTPQIYEAIFSGVPNNGVYNVTIGSEYTLIGNPYPSAISADMLITNYPGTLYFWTHNTPITNYNYTGDDYATYTLVGGVGTSAAINTGINNNTPNGKIAAGQGFFFKNTSTSTNIIFNNSLRLTNNNNQFFRTSQEKDRFWLEMTNDNGLYKQILIGYINGATNNIDGGYDGEILEAGNIISLYTIVDDKLLTIQGRQYPFNIDDSINLGYKTNISGDFKIKLSDVNGLFTTQNIYLQDLYSNTIHDLTQSPYTFNSVSGTFNDRFILRYTNNSLGNNDFIINNTIIYNKDNKINIDSNKIIKNVKVYDITGKLLYDNNFNSNNVFFNLECSKQILFVKIKTEDDQVITRKILND